MRERWLQSLWGKQNWNSWPLRTCQGQTIHVLDPGQWNDDQGPDFLGAQVFIDQVLWVGSVEIHVRSSDWFLHQHPNDPNYLPVILHVVWMQAPKQPDLPTLELSRYLRLPQLKQVLMQLGDIDQVACHRVMRPVPASVWHPFRRKLLAIRRERKLSGMIAGRSGGLRQSLSRQLGAWVNREVFAQIDQSISADVLRVVRQDLVGLTALYLGQAGLLTASAGDTHWAQMQSIYRALRDTYSLNPPYRSLLWMRIRPSAHPTQRIAQLAALIYAGGDDPRFWIDHSPKEIRFFLRSIQIQTCGEVVTGCSEGLIDSLLINLWSYLNTRDSAEGEERLSLFPFEDNRFTRRFHRLALPDGTAADSQAILELHAGRCQLNGCAACDLGSQWAQVQAPQSI